MTRPILVTGSLPEGVRPEVDEEVLTPSRGTRTSENIDFTAETTPPIAPPGAGLLKGLGGCAPVIVVLVLEIVVACQLAVYGIFSHILVSV